MKLGIDFGTSYSSAAVFNDGKLEVINFNRGSQFRTAAYFPEKIPSLTDYELTPQLKKMVQDHLRQSKAEHARNLKRAQALRQQAMAEKNAKRRDEQLSMISMPAERSEEELIREAERVVRQQWIDEQVRRAQGETGKSKDALFGDEAIDAFLSEGTGRLVQSPKSMLGFQMANHVRTTVTDIVANVFDHIRRNAITQLKGPVTRAVVGRPVVFRSSMGERGTAQALDIIRRAAVSVGFDEVHFLEEPIAAAMAYHRECRDRMSVLIFDIGGGTTDFAFVELGANKRPRVLGSWGIPVGGSDVDREFSLAAFMPLFGKNQTNVPNKHYFDAAAVTDVVRQVDFLKHNYKQLDPPYGPRLRALQVPGKTSQLGLTVEHSKIHLSEHDTAEARIDYIEENLVATSTREVLLACSDRIRINMERKMEEINQSMGKAPDVVFLTGGMSRSPFIGEMVRRHFPASRIVKGNASFGVVNGLACAANV
ncbi:heat-shock protein Hsp70 [Dyella monticola]|uniref:Heat-shock protein Hsp70 n=1 Tax=Dyella monticola TaxID=1927958 RepID=A0A370X5A0_9GAMM|nr:Hsp70 family protein [Dyella monticola]RDS83594.1 heat-shock protein Hsp70 [Dyella monticola]